METTKVTKYFTFEKSMTLVSQVQVLSSKSHMKNLTIVKMIKMEIVPKINIFGLSMKMKSGLEKIF